MSAAVILKELEVKPGQIRDMSIEEVEHSLREIEEEVFNLNLRRDKARLMTVLHEHKLKIRELSASSHILDSVDKESGDKE